MAHVRAAFPGGQLAREAVTLFLIAALAALGTALLHPRAPGYAEGKPDAGQILLANVPEPVLWVDARNREDYENEHIPGAILLNETEWDTLLFEFFEVWDPDLPVVVYCGETACLASKAVADRLRRELDIGTFHHLAGGWEEWKRAQR